MSTSEQEGTDPEVGSVAEETAKLLGALSGWAKDHGADVGSGLGAGLGAGLGGAFHEASSHFATGGDDCKYCPLCRVVHIVRESSPEVRTHLAIAAASLAQAASAVLQAAVPDEEKAARREPVEKIDLEDDSEDDSDGGDDLGGAADFGPFDGPFG